jgi:hypothetical protein
MGRCLGPGRKRPEVVTDGVNSYFSNFVSSSRHFNCTCDVAGCSSISIPDRMAHDSFTSGDSNPGRLTLYFGSYSESIPSLIPVFLVPFFSLPKNDE